MDKGMAGLVRLGLGWRDGGKALHREAIESV